MTREAATSMRAAIDQGLEMEPCPTCGALMVVEVGESCPNEECDYVVAEPEPYAVEHWR